MSLVQHYVELTVVKIQEIESQSGARRFHILGGGGSKTPILQSFHAGANPPPPDPSEIEQLNRESEEAFSKEGDYGYRRIVCFQLGLIYDEKNAAVVVPDIVEKRIREFVSANPKPDQ